MNFKRGRFLCVALCAVFAALVALCFRAEPKVVMANPKEVDFAQSAIHVEYWHGLYCYEKSTMEGECTFPMSEEGREEMRRWLEEMAQGGITVMILSNNRNPARVERFCRELGISYEGHAGKPLARGFRRAMARV